MGKDKATDILLEALKQAMAGPGEQRLYKSGKLEGLFPGRTGANGEAAARALSEGMLEVVRSETKGKTSVEWVRVTPRGVEFVYEHESPVRAMEELREALQTTREGIPVWLAELRRDLVALGSRLTEDVQRWSHRLEALGRRVEEALRREAGSRPQVPAGPAGALPWTQDALAYLDRRTAGGVAADCPLPELFHALRHLHADLSLAAFHVGLRRLRDAQALSLKPFPGPPGELPEPEYALLDGARVLYFASFLNLAKSA